MFICAAGIELQPKQSEIIIFSGTIPECEYKESQKFSRLQKLSHDYQTSREECEFSIEISMKQRAFK